MLGRSIGLSEEQLQHLVDDPLPTGVYTEPEAAIVRYAQRSTRFLPIDESTYGALAAHFSIEQQVEICLVVGLAQIANRFNATFLTDVDESFLAANRAADLAAGACPIPYPSMPVPAPQTVARLAADRLNGAQRAATSPEPSGPANESWAGVDDADVSP